MTVPDAGLQRGIDTGSVSGFRSADGGSTWTRVPLPGCTDDPWARFGSGDEIYVACLTGAGAVLLHRSPDAGRTWAEPLPIPRGAGGPADKPVVAVDTSSTPSRGTVHVAFGQYFPTAGLRQRKVFGAAVASAPGFSGSFGAPRFVAHDNLGQQPIDAAVLTDGRLVLLFQDFASPAGLLAHRRTWMVRSADGGRSFSTPALAFEQRDNENPYALAADRSARHPDRLYLAVLGFWQRSQQPAAPAQAKGPADLYVLASDDGGESWGPPAPVTPPPATAGAQVPAIAVNSDGVVGVAWYDTRRDPAGLCYDISFSASVDGGQTFLPAVRVTPEPSCPRASARQHGVATRWSFGGDYSGLAAAADGRFQILWADSSSGVYQLRTAAARVVR
jgi:hypothetical protein